MTNTTNTITNTTNIRTNTTTGTDTAAKTLYYNGTILTMRGDEPETVQAVLTEGGRIIAAGAFETLKMLALQDAASPEALCLRDLKGQTMLPAFLDPHSHITAVARALSFAALQEADSFGHLLDILEAYKKMNGLKPGQWIVGTGYDHNRMKEGRHPDRFVLDQRFPDYPVLITHTSGHMGVANSMALQAMGITAATPDPEGGRIGRAAGIGAAGTESTGAGSSGTGLQGEPNGYLEETAFTGCGSVIPEPDLDQLCRQLAMAEQIYLEQGITTAQDGRTGPEEWRILSDAAKRKLLHVDIVAYAEMKDSRGLLRENPEYADGYRNHLRLGGYKIFLDGSPQGRTAWMTEPYEGGQKDYCGYPIYRDEEVKEFFAEALREGRQLLVHCNGDAAAQQMIDACRNAAEETGCSPDGIRPVMIHAQLVRRDQLKEMAELSMTASFFTAHTYYWGDIHRKNFGDGRALKISPARSAMEYGVNVTFHQDSPVILPNMLETIWCAVNRTSREGKNMGLLERVTPFEALKAVTINAAYQYGEEQEKGTIEPGKRADFVLLDRNPLTAEEWSIREIRVQETIKDGKTLYRNKTEMPE